jgi:hypothetical protein
MAKKLFPKRNVDENDKLLRETAQNDAKLAIALSQLEALKAQTKRLDSEDWKWIITQYLPAEIRRIEHESRNEKKIDPFSPTYEKQQLMAHAQIQQCEKLIGRFSDLCGQVQIQERYIRELKGYKSKLLKKSEANRKKIAQSE